MVSEHLHPTNRLSRLQHARRRASALPVDSAILTWEWEPISARTRSNEAPCRRQFLDAGGREHVPSLAELGRLRQLAADAAPTVTRRYQHSTPTATSARIRTSSSSTTYTPPVSAAILRRSRATRDQQSRGCWASRCAKSCCRESFSTSPMEAPPSKSRDPLVDNPRWRHTPRRSRQHFDIINGVRPDTHGWLTYVSPALPEDLQWAHAWKSSALRRSSNLASKQQLPDHAGQWQPGGRFRGEAARMATTPKRWRACRSTTSGARRSVAYTASPGWADSAEPLASSVARSSCCGVVGRACRTVDELGLPPVLKRSPRKNAASCWSRARPGHGKSTTLHRSRDSNTRRAHDRRDRTCTATTSQS